MEAPAWKEYINRAVDSEGDEYQFPYGIYFGSKIEDTVKNRVGTVVGISDKLVHVAFEDPIRLRITSYSEECFDAGYCRLA